MKKIYLLSLLCCFSIAAFAQVTTTFWSTGALGTFTTGNATATTRTDNNIVSTASTQRGYAVFDLTSIPAGSQINTATLGFYISTYGGSGTPSGWNTFGYAGDLSTVTTAAALYAAMVSGTSISTTTYGTAAGNSVLASTASIVAFLQAHIGSKVSICWTGGGTRIYNIRGENGSSISTTAVNHAPYITIDYCPPPVSVSATASPATICEGDNLSLTGVGAGSGTLSWAWTGPAGYSATAMSPTFTTGVGASGVYTLTVTNNCTTGAGTFTAYTAAVTANPRPDPILGGTGVCLSSTTALSETSTGGTWTSNNSSIASINPATGLVSGVAVGTTTITYTFTSTTGCYITEPMTVNTPPDPIAGPTRVCVADGITLTDGVSGGVWTVNLPGNATVGSLSGIVTGVAAGSVNVTYTTEGCAPVSYGVDVNDLPSPISGPSDVCIGSLITLSDPDPGGDWSSSDISRATVGITGDVMGVAPGLVNIIFTSPSTSCQVTYPVAVNSLPLAIAGVTSVCVAGTTTLTDATPGGTWSGGFPSAAIAPTGDVTGVAVGVSDVTYTVAATSCYVTVPVSVNPSPAPIIGASVICQGATAPYTNADPGGNWSSVNVAIATVGGTTGIVSGAGPGVTTIIYTLPTTCAINAVVTVNAAPSSGISPAGPTTFCAGGNVVLNGPSGAGFSYQWLRDGVAISGATTFSFTAGTSGDYSLRITNANSCSNVSPATHVTAGITGVLSNASPLEFCVGDHVVLHVNTGSATGTITYQWALNGAAIPLANDSTYTANASGEYSVSINISGGAGTCAIISDTDVVNVHPLPVPTVIYNGTMLSTAAGYSTYQWYLNSVAIPGANSNVLVPSSNGTFKVKVGDGNHCAGVSTALLITSVGVPVITGGATVTISPNPATTTLHIAASVPVRTIITSIEGKVLADQANTSDINIASLPSGLYLVSVYDTNGTRLLTDKFVKE